MCLFSVDFGMSINRIAGWGLGGGYIPIGFAGRDLELLHVFAEQGADHVLLPPARPSDRESGNNLHVRSDRGKGVVVVVGGGGGGGGGGGKEQRMHSSVNMREA